MDERLWSKARSLAAAFSEAYDEDVALVLGEGLLDALAELLVPEGEQNEAVDDAKRQHPAHSPAVGSLTKAAEGLTATAFNFDPQHPEFLEGKNAYANAPIGTLIEDFGGGPQYFKYHDGWMDRSGLPCPPMWNKRKVLHWGLS